MKTLASPKVIMFISLVLFLWVEVAEARLFRSSGRGTQQDQYSDTIYYVNNAHLNEVGIKPDSYDTWSNWAGDSNNRTGGFQGVEAVPGGDGGCVKAVIEDDKDAAYLEIEYLEFQISDAKIHEPELVAGLEAELAPLQAAYNTLYASEPCVWEFEQGEDLFAWGSFDFFFDSADVNYDVNWSITGTNGSWGISGSVNTQSGLTDPNDPSQSIALGSVLLDSPAPIDLVAGDYSIDVQVTMSSQNGRFIMESLNHPDEAIRIEEVCKDNPEYSVWLAQEQAVEDVYGNWLDANPGVGNAGYDAWLAESSTQEALRNDFYDAEPVIEICGYSSIRNTSAATYEFYNRPYAESVFAPTTFYSISETLRILPASQQDQVINASAPATIGTFVFGIGGLLLRRRARLNAR